MTDFETRKADWLSFEEALDRVLSTPATGPERVDLEDALGRAVAEHIVSPFTLPPGPSSHMDGYALRADDFVRSGTDPSGPLEVVGTSRPGHPW
ncbi:MAG: molybdopterin molybdotransferase, partial [Gemmatimonadota bacterium]